MLRVDTMGLVIAYLVPIAAAAEKGPDSAAFPAIGSAGNRCVVA